MCCTVYTIRSILVVCNFVNSQNEKWIKLDRGAALACDVAFANYHWWKSKECDIASFSQHFGCDEEHCRVTPDDYVNGFFYYCCTESDVLPDQAATGKRTCFQISGKVHFHCFHWVINWTFLSLSPSYPLLPHSLHRDNILLCTRIRYIWHKGDSIRGAQCAVNSHVSSDQFQHGTTQC